MFSRFQNSLGGLQNNTVLLAFANMSQTMGLGIISDAALYLCVRFTVPLFFLPLRRC